MGVTIKVTDEAGVNYDIQWEDHHTLLEWRASSASKLNPAEV